MGLKGKRKGQLVTWMWKKSCDYSSRRSPDRAVPFSEETQPLTTLSLPSNLLLDSPIDQT